MEATAKAISMFVNELDKILTADKFDELMTFMKEYLHEHPDEIDNVYTVFKCSFSSVSIIVEREKISSIKNKEKIFNDQELIFEVIIKKDCNQEKMKFCLDSV